MQHPALGGIYSPHTPKEPLEKADRILERRLIRRSSFVITGECFFPATSRYCSNGYLINCTDALEIIIGLTGDYAFCQPLFQRLFWGVWAIYTPPRPVATCCWMPEKLKEVLPKQTNISNHPSKA